MRLRANCFLLAGLLLSSVNCSPPPASAPTKRVNGAPTSSAGTAAAGDVPPAPRFDRIDYAHPDQYIAIPPSLGDRVAIERIASALGGNTTEEKLAAIGAWIDAHVKYLQDDARDGKYHWRNFDRLVADGTHGGCADQSILFGALARAKGIPTVWVKTMDVDWIHEFVRTRGAVSSWRGHVFLEVFADGHWKLLDATLLRIYEPYDTRSRILPGLRYAYDKGGDPFALVLSSRAELWRRQTSTYFAALDASGLPMTDGEGRSLSPGCYVVCNRPYCGWAVNRCDAGGLPRAMSFNTGFERYLADAVAQTLIVIVLGESSALPDRYWPDQTTITRADVARRMNENPSGVFCRKRPDRTRVFVVYGKDDEALRRAMDRLDVSKDCG